MQLVFLESDDQTIAEVLVHEGEERRSRRGIRTGSTFGAQNVLPWKRGVRLLLLSYHVLECSGAKTIHHGLAAVQTPANQEGALGRCPIMHRKKFE
jgi:hypothetical protein